MNFCTFPEVKLGLKTINNLFGAFRWYLNISSYNSIDTPNWGAIFLNSTNNGWGVLASMLLDIMK